MTGTVTTSEPAVRRPVAAPVVAGALGVGALVVFHLVDPAGGPVVCPFRAMTGLACPLCGVTRMAHQLAIGDPLHAFRLNALTFVLAPFVAWWAFVTLTAMLGGPRWRAPAVTRRAAWILVAATAAFWILRNLPALHAFRSF